MDNYPPHKQKPQLLILLDRIGARSSTLRRDDCGDWAIYGRHGHIYAVPMDQNATEEGFQLVYTGLRNRWPRVKELLHFASVTQDGSGEGCLVISRLPTHDEGHVIRYCFGIPKIIELNEEDRADRVRRFERQIYQI